MKYMRCNGFILLILVLSISSCVPAYHQKQYSLHEITGTWLGYEPSNGLYCELRIRQDGAGVMGLMFLDQEPKISHFTDLVQSNDAFIVSLTVPSEGSVLIKPSLPGLSLIMKGPDDEVLTVFLMREADWSRRNERMKSAISSQEKGK